MLPIRNFKTCTRIAIKYYLMHFYLDNRGLKLWFLISDFRPREVYSVH